MTPATKGRLLAAIAFPLLLLHLAPSHADPLAAAAAVAGSAIERLPHISIRSVGAGDPVILIPGLSSPRDVWDGVVPQLAKTHRVIVVQINGFGGDDPGANLQPGILDGTVADLNGYITREKLGRPAIVGHSLGGLVALMFARAHPQAVSRIMVVDSLPFYGMLFGPAVTVPMVQPRAAAMRDQLAASYGKPADPAAAEAIADRLALKPASQAQVKAWALAADPRVTGAAMYEDLSTDLRPDMATIATPITLVYPWSETKPSADALYKGAYAAAPHVTYVDIGDARHFVMLDQPQAFAAALATFADQK